MDADGEDVRARRFTVTRWRQGYERSEVIALLAFAATALDAARGRPVALPAAGRRAGPVDAPSARPCCARATTSARSTSSSRPWRAALDALASAPDAAAASCRREPAAARARPCSESASPASSGVWRAWSSAADSASSWVGRALRRAARGPLG